MGIWGVNTPSIFIYGGTIMPGRLHGKDIDIVSIFEAVGQFQAKKISAKELKAVECNACPGPGSCGGMYTANTMSAAIEAMGMSLPLSATTPAISKQKASECETAGGENKKTLSLHDALPISSLFCLLIAGVVALYGKLIPIASIAADIVLAVYIPPP